MTYLDCRYHTRRMQRIFCVNFSADARFVLTGSDDTNIRIWKAQASAPLCCFCNWMWFVDKPTKREESKLEYMESLKKKYSSFPEVRKISRHRHLPKVIKKMKDKEENKKKQDVKVFNEMEWFWKVVCWTLQKKIAFVNYKHLGAGEACRAHNPEVRRSKLRGATFYPWVLME